MDIGAKPKNRFLFMLVINIVTDKPLWECHYILIRQAVHYVKMSSSKLSKIARQHENTWSQLHQRLMNLPFQYNELFEENVWEFISKKSDSLSTSVGYLIPCLLATTAFVASTGGLIDNATHESPFNIYIMFVGPPSTGNSQALKEAALQPVTTLIENEDLPNFLIEKCTSSALAKIVADNGKGFVVSPELFDLLNKLLKSDDENATGDAQLLCELFSGERISYRYASEKIREIGSNVSFSIVGATQVPFAARLITRMDQGHGLFDRFLFLFPSCLRPSVEETEAARLWLQGQQLNNFTDIFLEMHQQHSNRRSVYKFSEDAQQFLSKLQNEQIQDINNAINEGHPPPKSKKMDLIRRIASNLIEGQRPCHPHQRVPLASVKRAQKFVEFAESQKHIATEFSDDGAPETSELSMSIGSLTCWNFGNRCTVEFQPSADQSWQSWANNELNQAATYPSPYANVHKGNMCVMGGTIGTGPSDTWIPPSKDKRKKDLDKLDNFRKSLSSSLNDKQRHTKELEFMRDNGLRQCGPSRIRDFANRQRPEPVHNEINVWQHLLNLIYKESLMRNVVDKFLEVLSAPVGKDAPIDPMVSARPKASHTPHSEGVGERVREYDLPSQKAGTL
ncbi:hypothetical protein QZH41_000036 [Actinostola sp. cb2023]|nr:hypothetical protein QZH41_000036 [Actinostola sp. cb2023]